MACPRAFGQRLAPLAMAFNAAKDNRIFTPNTATFHHSPTGSLKLGINMFDSGFGFVSLIF